MKYLTVSFFRSPLFLIFSIVLCMVLIIGSGPYVLLHGHHYPLVVFPFLLCNPVRAKLLWQTNYRPLITKFLSFFQSYKASSSLLYLSFGILIFINFSSKLTMYIFMAASLLRKLKADFGLNCSRRNLISSILKC